MSRITLAPNASGSGTLTVAAPNTNTDRTITLPDATGTAVVNKGSEIFNIDSGGNLGMGTTSPVGAGLTLNLQGSTTSSYSSIVAGSPSNANFVSFYSGQTVDPNPSIVYNNSLRIGSATSPNTSGYAERMRIDSSGNVGIGTTSPGAKLDVTNNQAALSYLIDTSNITNGGSSIWRMITRNIANTGTTSVEFYKPTGSGFSLLNNDTNGSNFTAFNVGASERMRIDASGNLLVGIAAANNAATSSAFQYLVGSNLVCSKSTTANTNQIVFNNPNGQVGTINTNASATAYNTSSDYRLKENVQPMVGALDKIALLNPVTYNWKSDGSDGQGFIAHELQAIVPDCVSGEKDATDADGKPQYQGVDTSFLVATLVAAIQEQQQMIQALQADIAALKGV